MLYASQASTPGMPLDDMASLGLKTLSHVSTWAAKVQRLVAKPSKGWRSAEIFEDHYQRHTASFGKISKRQYTQKAFNFLEEAQKGKYPMKVNTNGLIRVYDKTTNTFGSYNPNGTIKTLFKPKDQESYWLKQPGKLLEVLK